MSINLILKTWRFGKNFRLACSLSCGLVITSLALSPSYSWAANTSNPAKVEDASDQNPTYLRDILPIFIGNCGRCHNQQSRFIYNWLDYKTAYADRWEIRRRVWDSWKGHYYKEAMPIDNSPESLGLTDAQRDTIRNWVETGGAMGVAPVVTAPLSTGDRVEAGHRLFTTLCTACHQVSGKGIPSVFPPLAGSDFLNADKNRAIKIVIGGRQGEVVVNGVKYNNSMPAFPLNDEDTASVLTYVYASFGNSGQEVTPDEVKAVRGQ